MRVRLVENADGTLTVARGRYRETIDPRGKGPVELHDAVRWACITAGAPLSEERVTELLWHGRERA